MSRPVCGAPKTDGGSCSTHFGLCEDCGHCWSHCQHKGVQRRAARARGGKVTGQRRREESNEPLRVRVVHPEEAPAPPKTIEDATEWLSWLTWAIATGKVDARTGHDATYALRAFLDGRKAVDRTDERIRTLQDQLKRLRAMAEEGR